jgi:hypothetical protein
MKSAKEPAHEKAVVSADTVVFCVGDRVSFRGLTRLPSPEGGHYCIASGQRGKIKSILPKFTVLVGPESVPVFIDVRRASEFLEKLNEE